MQNVKQSPCQYCEKRYPACHSKCADYISFRQSRDKFLSDIRQSNSMKFGASRSAVCFSHSANVGKSHKK